MYREEPVVFGGAVTFNVDWSSGARELHYSFIHNVVTDNITAAGTVQGDATLLSGGRMHRVTTVPANSGVILTPNANVSGLYMNVLNHGANALNIYPQVGATITTEANVNLGANIPIVLAVGTSIQLVSLGALAWVEWKQ